MADKSKSESTSKVRTKDNTFAARLKYCVKKVGSAKALSAMTGIPQSTISDYTSEKTEPPRDKLVLLASASEVSVGWLAAGEGSPISVSSGLPDRLRYCIRNSSMGRIVYETGIPQIIITGLLNGSKPDPSHLTAIAEASGVDRHWLATGIGEPTPRKLMPVDVKDMALAPPNNDVVMVPSINIEASCGGGAVVYDEHVESIAIDAAWVREALVSPADLFFLPTSGESMEPTIRAGEPVLCSRAEHHVKPRDGIFVVRLEGHLLIKRIQYLPGAKLRLSSDNPAYTPFEVALNDGMDFAILGMVLWVFRRI